MSNERRLFTRIPFVANVEVVIDGVPHPAELHDISLMGVLVRVDDGASAALDTPVHVLLALDTERTVVIATHERDLAGLIDRTVELVDGEVVRQSEAAV